MSIAVVSTTPWPGIRLPTAIDTSMPRTSFHEWMQRREEVPDTMQLALAIARSGAAGISRDDLAKVLRLSSEIVESLLRALVVAGQVTALQVNGRRVYRTSM